MVDQQVAKKAKLDPSNMDQQANIIIQFKSQEGELLGPELDVPQTSTKAQLEALVNSYQAEQDKVPYAFYINNEELNSDLGGHVSSRQLSVESALTIVYQPQAIFRIRPVSRCTASLPGHSDAVLSVHYSPDGTCLASGSGDTTVRLWDLSTHTPHSTCSGHKSWVLVVAWSPDGVYLVSGDKDGKILVWQSDTGQLAGACQGHTKWITSLAWEPTHKALPCRRFCSASRDYTIRVWDATTRQQLLCMSSHTMVVTCVKWGGCGLIYSSSRDSNINVWNSSSGTLVRQLKGHAHWVNSLALSTDHVIRTGAFDLTSANGVNADSTNDEKIEVANKRYQQVRGSGERMVSGSDDFSMILWKPETMKKPVARLTGHQQCINMVSFSPDGLWLASASFDKSVKLWDGMTGVFIATLRGHVGPVYQIAWAPDSRLLVSGSADSTVKVFDVHKRKLLVDLPGHSDAVFAVDWSPDGGGVASGGKDKILKIWKH